MNKAEERRFRMDWKKSGKSVGTVSKCVVNIGKRTRLENIAVYMEELF